MRLVQYRTKQGSRAGVVIEDRVVDLHARANAAGLDANIFRSMRALLETGESALAFVSGLRVDRESFPLADVQLDYPVQARKIVAIGLNYMDHAKEANLKIPAAPLCFAKFTSSLSGPYDPILLPGDDAQVDFEGELGVVIGRRAKGVTEAQAMHCVAGYVVFNDVSARKWQFDDGQWTRGKSPDTFSPNGPWIVTPHEIPNPGALRITTRVNEEIMQDSNTSQLIFSVPRLISYLSHSFSFEPGDLIATGTPSGVGFSRKPPVYLQEGDMVEVEIEKIGKIANRVERGC